MPDILLPGCTPTPLAGYLKALGVFRLLAEQKCPELTACWKQDMLCLNGPLTLDDVMHFFLEKYRPTPIIAPWNGGSGFHPGDNQEGFGPLASSTSERFAAIANSIRLGQRVLSGMQLSAKPEKGQKPHLLQGLRNEADEALLEWIDAAFVLTGGEPSYPPLLGTGGNDGNLDFTNNCMQHIVALFDMASGRPADSGVPLLHQALCGDATPFLVRKSIGQFAPGQAGGANATSGFSSDSLMNSWDFVFMLEGAMLLAAGATRRLESSSRATLSYPFMVHASGAGSGGLDAEDAQDKIRGEIWLPLWTRPVSLGELRALFSEGRATVGRKPARDGLDFARAIGQLGVSRGIDAFERFAFLKRNGLSYLATPLGRFVCEHNPRNELLTDLELGGFLDALRREARGDKCPASLKRTVSQLESSLFALTRPGSGSIQVQRALCALGAVMQTMARSPGLQRNLPRLPVLSERWVEQSADDTPEFRTALALASLAGVREYLFPMTHDKGRWQWHKESRRYCWHTGSLAENLAGLVERRVLEAGRSPASADPFQTVHTLGATRADLADQLHRSVDESLLSSLLLGLTFCRLPESAIARESPDGMTDLPIAVSILKPFFTPARQLQFLGWLEPGRSLGGTSELIRLLAANQVRRAVELAWRRARIAGLGWPTGSAPAVSGLDGRHLLAMLSIPLQTRELAGLLPAHKPDTTRTLQNLQSLE